jgi:uncharacterized protein
MQLLPRDEKFFDLLVEQGRIVFEVSRLLADGLAAHSTPPDFRENARQIRDLELRGDAMLRKIYRRLHKTFITPIDPEDIHQLASMIDQVLDYLDTAAYRFEAYGLEHSRGKITEIVRMVHECVVAMLKALESLARDGVKRPDELTARCEEINLREIETENRVREVVRDLFATERDPIALIKQKDYYELLESTANRCEDVAEILEAIALKNS